ncbi:MAG: DoxX family protein [Thermodesulfobacteriota bacterium]
MNSWREKSLAFGVLWLRVLMGLGISLFHGYGKVFGGRMEQFAEGVAKIGFPMPDLFAWAAALSEFLGGILITLGLGTRVAASFIFFTMSVAAFNRHAADPFDVKERALLYWVIAMAIMLLGPGRFSLDYLICRYFKKGS